MIEVEEEIEKIKSPHPIIVGFGPSFDELTEFHISATSSKLYIQCYSFNHSLVNRYCVIFLWHFTILSP